MASLFSFLRGVRPAPRPDPPDPYGLTPVPVDIAQLAPILGSLIAGQPALEPQAPSLVAPPPPNVGDLYGGATPADPASALYGAAGGSPAPAPTLAPVAAAPASPPAKHGGFLGMQWNPDYTPNQRWMALAAGLQDIGDIGIDGPGNHLDYLLHGDPEHKIPGYDTQNAASRQQAGLARAAALLPGDDANSALLRYFIAAGADDKNPAYKALAEARMGYHDVGKGGLGVGLPGGPIYNPDPVVVNDSVVAPNPFTGAAPVLGGALPPKAQTPAETARTQAETENLRSLMEDRAKAHQTLAGVTADNHPIWHDTTGAHPDEIGNQPINAKPGANSSRYTTMFNAWLSNHDGDVQGALDYAGGIKGKTLSEQQIQVAAGRAAVADHIASMDMSAPTAAEVAAQAARIRGTPSANVPPPAAGPPKTSGSWPVPQNAARAVFENDEKARGLEAARRDFDAHYGPGSTRHYIGR